ncbi:MAG: hypothetical protein MUP16_01065 [Sedimentisphaerales bacterium]|nr:hypothetical protein [Sedimentisphaerales bacterium]
MTKKSKTILTATIVLAAVVAVAVPIAVHWASKPNFSKMNPRQIREYFDSNEFRDANEQTRRGIREQMGEVMQARMTAQINGYFALPEGDQRTAYLDKTIDEMQARRAEFLAGRDPNRPPDGNGFGRFGTPDANGRPRFGQRGANSRQRPRINPERMRARSERFSADTRVKMMQFRRELRARMEQRGIQGPMMGPGGPGRGFGGRPGRPPD